MMNDIARADQSTFSRAIGLISRGVTDPNIVFKDIRGFGKLEDELREKYS